MKIYLSLALFAIIIYQVNAQTNKPVYPSIPTAKETKKLTVVPDFAENLKVIEATAVSNNASMSEQFGEPNKEYQGRNVFPTYDTTMYAVFDKTIKIYTLIPKKSVLKIGSKNAKQFAEKGDGSFKDYKDFISSEGAFIKTIEVTKMEDNYTIPKVIADAALAKDETCIITYKGVPVNAFTVIDTSNKPK